jgi:hypothetical protein
MHDRSQIGNHASSPRRIFDRRDSTTWTSEAPGQKRQKQEHDDHEAGDPDGGTRGVGENRLHQFMTRGGIDQADHDNQGRGVPELADRGQKDRRRHAVFPGSRGGASRQ